MKKSRIMVCISEFTLLDRSIINGRLMDDTIVVLISFDSDCTSFSILSKRRGSV